MFKEPPETTDTSQAEGLDVTEEDYDAVGENESREGGGVWNICFCQVSRRSSFLTIVLSNDVIQD